MIAETLGGMTVAELEERLSTSELFEWAEWFKIKNEENKKAAERARSKARRR